VAGVAASQHRRALAAGSRRWVLVFAKRGQRSCGLGWPLTPRRWVRWRRRRGVLTYSTSIWPMSRTRHAAALILISTLASEGKVRDAPQI